MLKVAPSILSANFAKLGDEVAAAAEAGADWIHLDVMDGLFVPNLTFGPPVIAAVRNRTNLPFEIHLMIEKPERSIAEYRKAGGDRLLVHAESTTHLHRTVSAVKELGAEVGVALNPATPLADVEAVLPDLNTLLIMTVNPGFGGQSFIPTMLPKIRAARELMRKVAPERPMELLVDGGINEDTARQVETAGATCAVAGSFVFGSKNYRERIEAVRGRQRRL